MKYGVAIAFFLVHEMRSYYEYSGRSGILTEVEYGIAIMSAW